jgi:hypothetical protein
VAACPPSCGTARAAEDAGNCESRTLLQASDSGRGIGKLPSQGPGEVARADDMGQEAAEAREERGEAVPRNYACGLHGHLAEHGGSPARPLPVTQPGGYPLQARPRGWPPATPALRADHHGPAPLDQRRRHQGQRPHAHWETGRLTSRACGCGVAQGGAKTIRPSPCAMAGPAATYRTEHVAAQRTSMVFAPPSVATRRSPARMRPAPVRRRASAAAAVSAACGAHVRVGASAVAGPVPAGPATAASASRRYPQLRPVTTISRARR